ncbi:torsin-1A-interacting protein 2-like isoform X1 [Protopterus annectens]|uniref:torsin-1A-interacting protein 2-like isoform X1 n=1 Tax=Protopterus annectens TaxID=7888 RepID=UPI001CFA6F1C|nr:torsin-1A-interacting protein 2-like isoform X1 [Protopterus annectens]
MALSNQSETKGGQLNTEDYVYLSEVQTSEQMPIRNADSIRYSSKTAIDIEQSEYPGTNSAPQNGELPSGKNDVVPRGSGPDMCKSEQKLDFGQKELKGAHDICEQSEDLQGVKMTRERKPDNVVQTDRVTRSRSENKSSVSSSGGGSSGSNVFSRAPIKNASKVKPVGPTESVGEKTSPEPKKKLVKQHRGEVSDTTDSSDEHMDDDDSTDDKGSDCSFEGTPEGKAKGTTPRNTSPSWSSYQHKPLVKTKDSPSVDTSQLDTSQQYHSSPAYRPDSYQSFSDACRPESFSDDEDPRKSFNFREEKRKQVDSVDTIRVKDDIGKENQKATNGKCTLCYRFIFFFCLPVVAAVSFIVWKNYDLPSVVEEENPVLKDFLRKYESLQLHFPGQEPWFWKRSRIALQKHLNTSSPSQPVILMFVGDQNTSKTLGCISQMVADSYSSSRSTQFDGAGKQQDDSNTVKLGIDSKLSSAFEEGKKAAVIQNFQHLPPSSTLIFYKFCDHENAAYKNVLILLTVLLEEELDEKISFRDLEDKVWNFLRAKFLTTEGPASHDTMDVDKLSGLWSRISHVVLPVRSVTKLETEGCD